MVRSFIANTRKVAEYVAGLWGSRQLDVPHQHRTHRASVAGGFTPERRWNPSGSCIANDVLISAEVITAIEMWKRLATIPSSQESSPESLRFLSPGDIGRFSVPRFRVAVDQMMSIIYSYDPFFSSLYFFIIKFLRGSFLRASRHHRWPWTLLAIKLIQMNP